LEGKKAKQGWRVKEGRIIGGCKGGSARLRRGVTNTELGELSSKMRDDSAGQEGP